MRSQCIHCEKQHHIDIQKGNVAPTVLIPRDLGIVEVFASLMNDAAKVAENGSAYPTPEPTISCTSTGLGTPPMAVGVEELNLKCLIKRSQMRLELPLKLRQNCTIWNTQRSKHLI